MNFDPTTAPLAVSAACVGMVLPFRAVGDMRYYLNGIYITPEPEGGAIVVATDGHTMGIAYDPDGYAPKGGMILPIGRGQASLLRKGGNVHADSEGRAYITDLAGRITWISPDPKIDGNFPDFAAVVPDPHTLSPGLICECNPVYLDRIRRAREASGRSRYASGVRWWHVTDAPTTTVAMAAIASNAIALVMPLAGGDTSPASEYLPPSLRRARTKAEAA